MVSWNRLFYERFIKKTSLKIRTTNISWVSEPLDGRGCPGEGKAIAPLRLGRHLRWARPPARSGQRHLGVPAGAASQISSLKQLPAPGTLSSKHRNQLKRSPAPLLLGRKHWQPEAPLERFLQEQPHPTLQAWGSLPPGRSQGQEIKRGGMAVTAWHSPLHTLPRNA